MNTGRAMPARTWFHDWRFTGAIILATIGAVFLFQSSQEKALNSNLLQVKADRAELLQLQHDIYLRSAPKSESLDVGAQIN